MTSEPMKPHQPFDILMAAFWRFYALSATVSSTLSLKFGKGMWDGLQGWRIPLGKNGFELCQTAESQQTLQASPALCTVGVGPIAEL